MLDYSWAAYNRKPLECCSLSLQHAVFRAIIIEFLFEIKMYMKSHLKGNEIMNIFYKHFKFNGVEFYMALHKHKVVKLK